MDQVLILSRASSPQQPGARRSSAALACCPWAHTATSTNKFWNYCHPHSATCHWTAFGLAIHSKGRNLAALAFLALSCFVGEEKIYCLFWVANKIPERITPIVWRAGAKYILSVLAHWVVCKILISSLVLINFFIYLKATQVVQLSGWLDRRNCNYWLYKDFWSILFQITFSSSNYKWGLCKQTVWVYSWYWCLQARYTVIKNWPYSTNLKGKTLINLHGLPSALETIVFRWIRQCFPFYSSLNNAFHNYTYILCSKIRQGWRIGQFYWKI